MLTEFTVKDYACLKDVTVSLHPFTVFVGPNGCGKTSVLEAINREANPPGKVYYRWPANTMSMLEDMLGVLNLRSQTEWERLERDFRKVCPHIATIRMGRGDKLYFGMANYRSGAVSEASLVVVYTLNILATLYEMDKPGVLLIDDLGQGLHPRSQRALVGVLLDYQTRNAGVQIIATTNSVYMLDGMPPEGLMLMALREDGTTACKPITAHRNYENWKDEFRPGELWSFFGEQWVTEGE